MRLAWQLSKCIYPYLYVRRDIRTVTRCRWSYDSREYVIGESDDAGAISAVSLR
jgi:hypothetical protein